MTDIHILSKGLILNAIKQRPLIRSAPPSVES